jgi:D-alanyl-D-alanine carboxypeptidase
MLPVRTTLVKVSYIIPSIYKDKSGNYIPLVNAGGKLVPAAADSLLKLHNAVVAAGSVHRISDCYRSYQQQQAARAKYDNWKRAGSPTSAPAFNSATMKKDFVAPPGFSNHEAGIAIDAAVSQLSFPNTPANLQLDMYWELAIPLGWTPIIKAPTEGVSECWHFDHWGEWKRVKDVFGYSIASMSAHLDIGIGCYGDDDEKLLQSQLQRAGIDIGSIDGMVGSKTKAGAKWAGIDAAKPDWDKLFKLESATEVIWKG